jgi:hypothetical protein
MRKVCELTSFEEFIKEIYSRHEEHARYGLRIGQVAMNLVGEFIDGQHTPLYNRLSEQNGDIY